MFDRVAGLDVGKETVTVCLRTPGPRGGRRSETRTFKTMTGSLQVMRDWLVEAGVSIAAMESCRLGGPLSHPADRRSDFEPPKQSAGRSQLEENGL
jgi:hypothetical protein